MIERHIRSFLAGRTRTVQSADDAGDSKPGMADNRLNRAYRTVDWALKQPWNEGEDGVIVPKWAIYTLIEASQARHEAKHARQMWHIVGLSGILLVSVGIFIGIVLFGG